MIYFIGCSGYQYDDWKGKFYPEDIKKKDWLPYYAEKFNSVEINNSFYGLPKKETVQRWHGLVPGNFRFTMKGSRYITHQKKLKYDNDLSEGVKRFYDVVSRLKGKLGAILWQLPGNLHKNLEKLEKFGDILETGFQNVIEFRHESWFNEEVYDILKKKKIGYCILSAPDDLPDIPVTTTDTAYVRFHGKYNWYADHYTKNEMIDWAGKIEKLKVGRVYIYFNNDHNAYAPDNAQMLGDFLNSK